LDSHHPLHIAHASFWISGSSSRDADGNYNDDDNNNNTEASPATRRPTNSMIHPKPFTIISAQDIERGVWQPRPDIVLMASDRNMIDLHTLDPDEDETLPMVDTTTGMVNLQQYC
jgi:hypothetical protein